MWRSISISSEEAGSKSGTLTSSVIVVVAVAAAAVLGGAAGTLWVHRTLNEISQESKQIHDQWEIEAVALTERLDLMRERLRHNEQLNLALSEAFNFRQKL